MKNIRAWFLTQTVSARAEILLLAIFFVTFVLGQLGRISLSSGVTIYAHDVVIGVWLIWHVRQLVQAVTQAIRWLPSHPLVFATTLWVLAGIIWGSIGHFELRPILVVLRTGAYVLFAYSVGQVFASRRPLLRGLLVLAGNLMLWLGLLQYIFLPDTRFLSILGWDDHYFRLIGPLFDPNFMGMLIVLTIIFTASIHWLASKRVQFLLQAYYAALLALTYSRASFATAGMTAFLLAWTPFPLKGWRIRHRVLLGLTSVAVFSLVLLLAPKPGGEGVKLLRTSTVTARQSTATQAIENISGVDLVLGKGLFFTSRTLTTGDASIPNHAQVPDNILVLLLSGTGIFGTILVLSSLIYWIGRLAEKETALAIALAVTLLHAQFNNTLFEPFISLFLLLAVLAPVRQIAAPLSVATRFRAKKSKKNQTSK